MTNSTHELPLIRKTDIEVDGGVGETTVDQCASAGANMMVSGTAVAQATDPKSVIEELRRIATERQVKRL